MKIFTAKVLFFLLILLLGIVSCSKTNHDKVEIIFCEDIVRPTPMKITYVNDKGEDLLFSSAPSFPFDSLNIYHYFDSKEFPNNGNKEYPTRFLVERESPSYLLIYGSPGNEGYFYIRFGNGPIDKIHFKGSRDPAQPCPQNKVDELYQNGSKRSVDKQTGVWKLVK